MPNPIKVLMHRAAGAKLPPVPEIERFGMDGEEAITRLLRAHFDCVVRNVAVPHKQLYLEKDLTVFHNGAAFVLEVKHWKGEIVCEGDKFCQNKENGTRKTLKSPVGTTNQFIRCMKEFYGTDTPIFGAVVFSEPDCTLKLPREMDGVALLHARDLVAHIQKTARKTKPAEAPLDPERLLRCTRFYSGDREFCKGILADCHLRCFAEDGSPARLDTTRLRYLTAEHQPLRLRDKLYVTYQNGSTAVFYNRDTILTVACLDGSFRTVALNHITHIVF